MTEMPEIVIFYKNTLKFRDNFATLGAYFGPCII